MSWFTKKNDSSYSITLAPENYKKFLEINENFNQKTNKK